MEVENINHDISEISIYLILPGSKTTLGTSVISCFDFATSGLNPVVVFWNGVT